MLILSLPAGRAPVTVSFSIYTKAGEVETTFGADAQRVFLEFGLPDRRRRVHVEPADGPRLPQREVGEEGAIMLSVNGESAVRLLVRAQLVYDEQGAAPFADARLAEFYEPLRGLEEALPEMLRQGPDRVPTSGAAFTHDDGFWNCVGQATAYGAELGGTVGFLTGVAVGALAGGAPALLSGPAGAVAGAAGGAAAGFLGGLATC